MSHKHYVLNKPYGYLSQFIYEGKRKSSKKLLGTLYPFAEGTMAIGRLDEKSEGLLLLTTDGKVSELVRSSAMEKEYFVMVDGIIDPFSIELLKKGVEIGLDGGKYLTKPCKARVLSSFENYNICDRFVREERHGPTSWMSISLTEGKFRQVRKMTAAVGFPTLRLVRVRIGKLLLTMDTGCIYELPETFFND